MNLLKSNKSMFSMIAVISFALAELLLSSFYKLSLLDHLMLILMTLVAFLSIYKSLLISLGASLTLVSGYGIFLILTDVNVNLSSYIFLCAPIIVCLFFNISKKTEPIKEEFITRLSEDIVVKKQVEETKQIEDKEEILDMEDIEEVLDIEDIEDIEEVLDIEEIEEMLDVEDIKETEEIVSETDELQTDLNKEILEYKNFGRNLSLMYFKVNSIDEISKLYEGYDDKNFILVITDLIDETIEMKKKHYNVDKDSFFIILENTDEETALLIKNDIINQTDVIEIIIEEKIKENNFDIELDIRFAEYDDSYMNAKEFINKTKNKLD